MKIYSIKDNQVGFMPPFSQANDNVAIRTFAGICAGEESIYAQNPNDFELWYLGELEEDTGKFIQIMPKKLKGAGEYVQRI